MTNTSPSLMAQLSHWEEDLKKNTIVTDEVDDDDTQSLSSSDDEQEDANDSGSDDDEEEDSEDDESDDDDDSSLGSIIERLEAEAATAAGSSMTPPPQSMVVMLCLSGGSGGGDSSQRRMRRFHGSMPKLDATEDDNRSLNSFMARMNNSQTYVQAATVVAADAAAADNSAPNATPTKATPRRSRSANAVGDMMKAERSTRDKNSPAMFLETLWKEIVLDEPTPTTSSTDGKEDNKIEKDNCDTKNKSSQVSLKDWIPPAFWDSYFEPVTDERQQRYKGQVVTAMRAQDLDTLRTIAQEEEGAMNACNRQGESLLHLACRRRNAPLVEFMLREAKVSPRVRDDWNKTPLHELCWHSRPGGDWPTSVLAVLREAPELLFAADRRGFLPLQYVPRDCWKEWCQFLNEHRAMLQWKIDFMDFQQTKCRLQATLALAQQHLERATATNN